MFIKKRLHGLVSENIFPYKWSHMKIVICIFLCSLLSSCSTAIAIADTAGSAIVYGAKTIVNTVDAITPDIVNKKEK
jgi:hypothetical protein